MTLQDLGSLGELVAAIATVVTLAYLALQIRQNTVQLKNSSRDARTAASTSFSLLEQNYLLQLGADRTSSSIHFRGLADFDSLDLEEQQQFVLLMAAYLTNYRQSIDLNREGVMSPGLWAQHQTQLRWVVSQPGFRSYWNTWSVTGSDEMSEAIRKAQADASFEAAAQQRDETGVE